MKNKLKKKKTKTKKEKPKALHNNLQQNPLNYSSVIRKKEKEIYFYTYTGMLKYC